MIQAWLEQNGPYSIIIDGANVAFWGQSFEQGRFQFSQIGDVVETVCSEMPEEKPLVVRFASILLKGHSRDSQESSDPCKTASLSRFVHICAFLCHVQPISSLVSPESCMRAKQ